MAKKSLPTGGGNVRKFSELLNPEDFKSPYLRCAELVHEPLVLLGFEWVRSNRGMYCRIDALRVRSHESVMIQTGAWPIRQALERLEEINGFPCAVSIVADGQTFRFVDATLPPNFDINGFVYQMTQVPLDFNPPSE